MARARSSVCGVGVTGPLAPFTDDLRLMLERSGYRPTTIVHHMREVACLGRWMEERHVRAVDLTDQCLAEYRAAARAADRTLGCPESLFRSLRGLIGNVTLEPALSSTLLDLLVAFRSHLLHERGLVASTVDAYVLRASRFLAWSAPAGDVSALLAADVTSAVLRESRIVSARSTKYFVTALRSFLRFCFVTGRAPADVSAAALGVSDRRRSSLPWGISTQDAGALLGSFNRRQPRGCRDYAIVLVLLRLGLRSAEVAGLALDDIDWRSGQVLVHGKGDREERLPLPADVGEAIVFYLKLGRHDTTGRALFLRLRAPIGPLGRGGVSGPIACAGRPSRHSSLDPAYTDRRPLMVQDVEEYLREAFTAQAEGAPTARGLADAARRRHRARRKQRLTSAAGASLAVLLITGGLTAALAPSRARARAPASNRHPAPAVATPWPTGAGGWTSCQTRTDDDQARASGTNDKELIPEVAVDPSSTPWPW